MPIYSIDDFQRDDSNGPANVFFKRKKKEQYQTSNCTI